VRGKRVPGIFVNRRGERGERKRRVASRPLGMSRGWGGLGGQKRSARRLKSRRVTKRHSMEKARSRQNNVECSSDGGFKGRKKAPLKTWNRGKGYGKRSTSGWSVTGS